MRPLLPKIGHLNTLTTGYVVKTQIERKLQIQFCQLKRKSKKKTREAVKPGQYLIIMGNAMKAILTIQVVNTVLIVVSGVSTLLYYQSHQDRGP